MVGLSRINILVFLFQIFVGNDVIAQPEKIKIARDTLFEINDFICFSNSDTTSQIAFIRNKYFRSSQLIRSAKGKINCTDKAENPPFTLMNADFTLDFCLWNNGKVYSVTLSFQDNGEVSPELIAGQLKRSDYKEEKQITEKKITVRTFHWRDRHHKLPERKVILHQQKNRIVSISFS